MFIAVNLVVDLLVGAIDPRIADGEADDVTAFPGHAVSAGRSSLAHARRRNAHQ